MEHVVLVDAQDNAIGTMEKMEAHHKGLLHRAFSILLFNSAGEMLLQRRAAGKYHSAGLWTNTCCSHPRPDESMSVATYRKLEQEMGIRLTPVFSHKFTYRVNLTPDLIEHEVDHVFTGVFDGTPMPNDEEVSDWRYITLPALQEEIRRHPESFTYWFKLIAAQPELQIPAITSSR